jgi:flagellar biosynthesis/type III secretory pathway protein FliH
MAFNGQEGKPLLKNKMKAAPSSKDSPKGSRKRTSRRNSIEKKTLHRRKPLLRKRFSQKENEQAEFGQTFNIGYNNGFAKGFEDGHQAAYENRT